MLQPGTSVHDCLDKNKIGTIVEITSRNADGHRYYVVIWDVVDMDICNPGYYNVRSNRLVESIVSLSFRAKLEKYL